MIHDVPAASRPLRTIGLEADLAVIGGGVAGTCCAIGAARAGLDVVLVQDRPVLGGNASSEVRLWVLGATAHMSNNNRWAREGGIIDEILVENWHRNPEGNSLIFDTILLEKVLAESRIKLLLNTAVHAVGKGTATRIESVQGFCSQNSTSYIVRAPLFCDASGDGIVGFLAGAAFRMGAESREEFGESLAPGQTYGELLGHSLYFYTRDTGAPVRYVPPAFALRDLTDAIPRYRDFNARDHGCRLWWIEYGGRRDTVHDTEEIKWELWKVVYGVWNYIKNSGKFPEAENLTLEWVGTIPGKRESRRFEGDYLLRQQDIIGQTAHPDVVAYGGWSIDLHPADGVYSAASGCNQWHPRGIYGIPYRCLYSRNVENLFLAGRIISSTHVAFGSTRVIGTSSHAAQAVAQAAALCRENGLLPREVGARSLPELQRRLLRDGQHLPGHHYTDPADLLADARLEPSSEYQLQALPPDGPWLDLDRSRAQILPVSGGPFALTLHLRASSATVLQAQLRTGRAPADFTPDRVLERLDVPLDPGEQEVKLSWKTDLPHGQYVFLVILANPELQIRASHERLTGVLALRHAWSHEPAPETGLTPMEMWCPERRPAGWNLAFAAEPPLYTFSAANLRNGLMRPTASPNAWLADRTDPAPTLTLRWPQSRSIRTIDLFFDTDLDHALESALMGHPERVSPFCVKHFRLLDERGEVLREETDWHQTLCRITLAAPVRTAVLRLELLQTQGGDTPAALFAIHCRG